MNTSYRSYLLRIWLESDDQPDWRAILESPVSGERHGFANLETLFTFLQHETDRLRNENMQTHEQRPEIILKPTRDSDVD